MITALNNFVNTNNNTYESSFNSVLVNLDRIIKPIKITTIGDDGIKFNIFSLTENDSIVATTEKMIIYLPQDYLNDENIFISLFKDIANDKVLKLTVDGILIDTINKTIITYHDFDTKKDYIAFLDKLIRESARLEKTFFVSKYDMQEERLYPSVINEEYFNFLNTVDIDNNIFSEYIERKNLLQNSPCTANISISESENGEVTVTIHKNNKLC